MAAHFDRPKQRITFSAEKASVALLPGAQDRLSLLLQLQALFAGDPRLLRPGTKIQIQTVGVSAAEVMTFEVIGRDSVPGMNEETPAVLVRKASQREFDPVLEFWVLESSPFTLVRFRSSQGNGDFIDHVILQEIDG